MIAMPVTVVVAVVTMIVRERGVEEKHKRGGAQDQSLSHE